MRSLIAFLIIPFAINASAAPLSDATFLRKLSLSLKGVPPSHADYLALSQQPSAQAKKTYLDQLTKVYISSMEHRDRLTFQISERLEVTPPGVSQNFINTNTLASNNLYEYVSNTRQDAMTDLLARLSTENLSWDRLLTEKSYTLFPAIMYVRNFSDLSFMAFVNDQIPIGDISVLNGDYMSRPTVQKPFAIAFKDDDPRIAGVVTTSRFNGRYNTTGINKNRRRAAAIFRTFLCDPMIPSIGSGGDRMHDFNDVAFAQQFEVTAPVTEAQIQSTVSPNARHGSDQQCAACHYKLDPLGRAFQSVGISLMPDPSPGALVFKSAISGQLVNVPLRGLGDLGAAVVKQPEYVDCQVSWFWQQYIGKDVRLTSTRKAEIAAAFESVGRKTNDFITYLVSQPEFREKPQTTSQYVTFDQVQPLLKRCDTCHSQLYDVPPFSKLPISLTNDKTDHASWIAEMVDHMGRPIGTKGHMPKDDDQWARSDIDLVKTWLAQGARDENGQPTVGGVK